MHTHKYKQALHRELPPQPAVGVGTRTVGRCQTDPCHLRTTTRLGGKDSRQGELPIFSGTQWRPAARSQAAGRGPQGLAGPGQRGAPRKSATDGSPPLAPSHLGAPSPAVHGPIPSPSLTHSPPVCVVLSLESGPPRGGGGGDAIRGSAAGSSYPPHEPARAPAPAPRSRPRARPAAGASPASRLPCHPAPSRRRRRRLSAKRSRLGLPCGPGPRPGPSLRSCRCHQTRQVEPRATACIPTAPPRRNHSAT